MRDRPVNLNLLTISFPVTAIASILHRISGVILFCAIPFLLGILHNTLFFPAMFTQIRNNMMHSATTKILLWATLSALIYHLLAGIRHLCMDAGYGESIATARISAYVVFAATIILCIMLGFKLC